jgi:dihydrofolate reductase
MKKRCLIVAFGKDNRVIGDEQKLPAWNLRDDMNFFKETTKGHIVIMGRKNYESIPEKFKPLPGRTNIVVTKDHSWRTKTPKEDVVKVTLSLWEALEKAEHLPGEKIFNIGGGEIYRLGLNSIVFDEVHITQVEGWFEGSVTFPKLNFSLCDNYKCTFEKSFEKEEGRNSHPFSIRSYERICFV